MENAIEALHMAFGVMIFVLALSVSINAFGDARKTSELILNYQDREYNYAYVQENKDSEGNVITERIVGLESIIPTVYKAYKENYKVVFKDIELYQKYNTTGKVTPIYSIDLEKDIIGSDKEKEQFLEVLLNGTQGNSALQSKYQRLGIFFSTDGRGLYDKLKGIKFKESLGIYYQEEIQGETGAPEANRTEKRVITYEKV